MNLYRGKFEHWLPGDLERHFKQLAEFPGNHKLEQMYEMNPLLKDCVACSGTGIVRVRKPTGPGVLGDPDYIDCLDCPFCEGWKVT